MITLGIPCIPEDIEKLFVLVGSINRQTQKPHDIIISLSGPIHGELGLEAKLKKLVHPTPLRIIYTPQRKKAGENRNTIAETSTQKYIMYIDADDLMDDRRIEIVSNVLKKKSNLIGLIHGLRYGPEKSTNYNVVLQDMYPIHIKNNQHLDFRGMNIHHGHPIILRSVIVRHKYTSMPRGQDAEFLRRIIGFYGNNPNNVKYLNLPLSIYQPRPLEEVKILANTP